MKAYPKISIVTPSFNQGKYIEQTIQSVLDQKYPNLEYIIIDGGSTDDTVEIIKKYQDRITYWVSERDKGQTDAINKGFVKCSGEIFNWINSDDYYEPGVFFTLVELFFSNNAVQVVCGKEWAFKNNDPAEKVLHPGSVIKENIFETIRVGIINQPCTFFRKKSIDAFFPLNDSLRYAMDRQLWWHYLLQYGQAHILQTKEIFSNFRLHPQSKSVAEGELFESEYNGLRLSLFKSLHAPAILQQQLPGTKEIDIKWDIRIQPAQCILAAFASYYAERHYIHDGLNITRSLMKLTLKWKRGRLNKTEWKMWIAANLLPARFTMSLKKLKQ